MKPKTQIQKEAAARSAKLPSISDQQKDWCRQKLFPGYFTRNRSTLYCLECGHSWKDKAVLVSTLGGATCPSCARQLVQFEHYQPGRRACEYAAILTVRDGWQVVRMIHATKRVRKHQPAEYYLQEVMQHWIMPDGRTVVMSKATLGLSGYIDAWVVGSELEIRPHSFRAHDRYTLVPDKILPGRKVLPVIRRNGFDGRFHGMAPVRLFAEILSNPRAETLLKAGQIALLKEEAFGRPIRYWPSVRICIRNGYVVKAADIWLDHLRLLEHFGRDLLSPKYVCPADLKAEHDRLVQKRQQEIQREQLEAKRAQMEQEQEQYLQSKRQFFGLRFQAGQLEIVPLKSVQEVYEEGQRLKHCVYVNGYHNRPNSLLLSARLQGEPVETIEVDLKAMEIRQCRGMHNKATQYNAEIMATINHNMSRIAACTRKMAG